jgi:RNA 2',3'-cyclic 3'-phosphodiesterase
MTRTFVAVELGDAARAWLRAEIERLRLAIPAARWVDPNGLHLTLAFLGEQDDARLAEVAPAVAEAAEGTQPFTLTIGAPGTFGPPAAPRVIWRGVGGAVGLLTALQRRVAAALTRRGFALESRPYAPHLTLARVSAALPPDQLGRLRAELAEATRQPTRAPDIAVASISVMKSEPLRPAARYTRLSAMPLGNSGGPPLARQAPANESNDPADD